MEQVIFGKTELSISRLGFGAAPIGHLETGKNQVKRILQYLLDQGVNVIDTAACYGASEQVIGESVADRRDEYVLISKCGHGEDLPGENFSEQKILASIDRSLQRLKTDHIDVMLVHSCDLDTLKKGEAIGAVAKAREQGKVRFAGYSGDNEAGAYAAELTDVAVIETSVNIADQRNIDLVLPRCVEHDVGVIAKRPIANAAWKQPDAQPGMYKNYASEYHRRLALMEVTPHELGYHGHTEVEWPEIALKFTLAQTGVHTAIVGTTSTVNAESNIAASRKNPLREQVIARLREAFAKARKADDKTWDART